MEELESCKKRILALAEDPTYLRKQENTRLMNLLFEIFEAEDKLIDRNNSSMYFRSQLTRGIRSLVEALKEKRRGAIELTKNN